MSKQINVLCEQLIIDGPQRILLIQRTRVSIHKIIIKKTLKYVNKNIFL